MNLETVLTISLLFYLGFMILLGIEYFTDKRKGHMEPEPKKKKKPERKLRVKRKDKGKTKTVKVKAKRKPEKTEEPGTEEEAPAELQKKPGELAVEYPAEWDEEEFE